MPSMRSLLLIGAFIALTNCNLSEKKGTHLTSNVILSSKIDTTSLPNSISEEQLETNAFDSLTNVYVDTATLQGKRHSIMNHFYLENGLVAPEYDTLFDLNYDKFKDYVIGYYGGSGTGIKNIVKVFIFNPKLNYYILDSQLSELTNPTFYIRQKKLQVFISVMAVVVVGNLSGLGISGQLLRSLRFTKKGTRQNGRLIILYKIRKKF